ncbi:MAG TPA: NFACT family protein [Blastocatellia bacterium]|nr:NFACT family protein [Blastocatellia bacterium]
MENLFLSALLDEIRPIVRGRAVSRILMAGDDLFIDFRLADDRLLKISVAPSWPALYLSDEQPASAAEARSTPGFLSLLRSRLVGYRLIDLRKEAFDRRVRLDFEGFDVAGDRKRLSLVAALTGRTSNLYLTDETGRVESMWMQRGGVEVGEVLSLDERPFDPGSLLDSLDDALTTEEIIERYFDAGQIFGPLIKKEFLARCPSLSPARAFRSLMTDLFFASPVPLLYSRIPLNQIGRRPFQVKTDLLLSHIELKLASGFARHEYGSLSEAAEAYSELRARASEFQREHVSLLQFLKGEIKRREKLLEAIGSDRARFDDPDRFKRLGDLLLANLQTARVSDGKARLVDYYDPDLPEIEVEIGQGQTLQQAASGYFTRYQKARRALSAIDARERELEAELEPLRAMLLEIEADPTLERINDILSRLDSSYRRKQGAKPPRRAERHARPASGRWFLSTDGYEIVVGKNDRDNDQITFRLARPQDVWLHAADYPGSHVIIRNPSRGEVPHRTIIEAAALAAFYSSARSQGKAAVHYTQRKFVTRPPRSKPGLVRLSSFKTVMVEPRADLERIAWQ